MRRYADIALDPIDLATTFKALADPTRIALLRMLANGKEHCVCNLAQDLNLAEYQVSRHLTPLRRLGLVVARREGTWMHYHACAEACTPILSALQSLLTPALLDGGSGGAGCCEPGVCAPAPRAAARGADAESRSPSAPPTTKKNTAASSSAYKVSTGAALGGVRNPPTPRK